jgi:hypothetical protein
MLQKKYKSYLELMAGGFNLWRGSADRVLHKEGAVQEFSMSKRKLKTREFFLFNDLLLKATRTGDNSLAFRAKFELADALTTMTYPQVWIKGADLQNCAVVQSGKEAWYLCFGTAAEMQAWTTAMEKFHNELIWTLDEQTRVIRPEEQDEQECDDEARELEARRMRRGRVNQMFQSDSDLVNGAPRSKSPGSDLEPEPAALT